jgi:hypothetical protein
MVTTMSRNRICMEPMRRLNIHPTGFTFFSFGVGWCEDGKKISRVPIMFSYVGSKKIILGKAYWTK